MEAALWGRAENVEVLLRYNPEKASKDRSGYTALDFAAPHVRNSKERSRRTAERSREDTYEADKQRRMIVRMLEDQPARSSISFAPSNHQDDDIRFLSLHKSSQTSSFKFCAPIADFPVSCLNKTVGRLDRGHPFPHTDAMSGCKHSGKGLDVISGERWTEEVFRVCQLVGHELPTRSGDSGRPGSFYASHAEKHLIAYFLSKHVFLEDEIPEDDLETTVRNLDALFLAEAPGETTEVDLEAPERGRYLRDLYLARPPVELRSATILVSSKVCENCRDFVKKVEMSYGLTIRVKYC